MKKITIRKTAKVYLVEITMPIFLRISGGYLAFISPEEAIEIRDEDPRTPAELFVVKKYFFPRPPQWRRSFRTHRPAACPAHYAAAG